MRLIELAKKTGRGLALSAALLGMASLAAAPAAYARDWHGGGHWHGDGGWHHGGGWGGGAVALGLLGGALAGAAIASSTPYYYGYSYPYYGYSYGYSPYGYYYGY